MQKKVLNNSAKVSICLIKFFVKIFQNLLTNNNKNFNVY